MQTDTVSASTGSAAPGTATQNPEQVKPEATSTAPDMSGVLEEVKKLTVGLGKAFGELRELKKSFAPSKPAEEPKPQQDETLREQLKRLQDEQKQLMEEVGGARNERKRAQILTALASKGLDEEGASLAINHIEATYGGRIQVQGSNVVYINDMDEAEPIKNLVDKVFASKAMQRLIPAKPSGPNGEGLRTDSRTSNAPHPFSAMSYDEIMKQPPGRLYEYKSEHKAEFDAKKKKALGLS